MHSMLRTGGSAATRTGPAQKGTAAPGDRRCYVLSGKCPAGPPFPSLPGSSPGDTKCLLRSHWAGQGTPLHTPHCFELELFSSFIFLLTLIFFLVGVEQFKTTRTQVTFREITRLIPFE